MYGLDIETDTSVGGLDPAVAAVVAVAISGEAWTKVFAGAERVVLEGTDAFLGELEPGVIATWNGARFDLPYLADRARLLDIDLRLQIEPAPRPSSRRTPLPGHDGAYRACWHGHAHLDTYQVYRADVGASLGLPCGLKPLARFVGLDPVDVDRTRLHELSPAQLDEYVASDAVLTRELTLRRWPSARLAIDRMAAGQRRPAHPTDVGGIHSSAISSSTAR